jgi:hypothetical protein
MNTAIAPSRPAGDIIENVLIKGDLGKLTPAERSDYYLRVCESVGLNPLTKPFEYIVLNGRLTLYALRGCTDQLRAIHEVSVVALDESERDGVYIVTAKVRNGKGRTDMAKGAVMIGNLRGEVLANAMMKAETKAKRRATLSICGLGMLDETEIDTIPGARTPPMPGPNRIMAPEPPPASPPHDAETGEVRATPYAIPVGAGSDAWVEYARAYAATIEACVSLDEANDWAEINQSHLDEMKQEAPKLYARLALRVAQARANLVRPGDMVGDENSEGAG